MKTGWILAALVGAVIVAAWAPCAAQEPVRDFSQLNTRLRPGDTIWVTDAQGREVKGRILSLGAEELTLEGRGDRTFRAPDVTAITVRRGDSLGNGALIGLAVGGLGTGLACLATAEGQDKEWCVVVSAVYAGIGSAIGVGIDAMIPGKKLVTYRARGAAGRPQARLRAAPLLTPRAKGVAVSFAF